MDRLKHSLMAGLVAAAALAPGCTYSAGNFRSLAGAFPGEQLTVGCLDIAIDRHVDSIIEGPAAKYSFGNRCDAAVVIDFTAVVATGLAASGAVVPLRPYDPAGVLAPHTLDGRRFGSEIIEYYATEVDVPLTHVCLDVSRLDVGAAVGAPVAVCLPLSAAAIAIATPEGQVR